MLDNLDLWDFLLKLGTALWVGGVTVVGWILMRSKQNKADIDKIKEQHKKDIKAISDSLTKAMKKMEANLGDKITRIDDRVDTIELDLRALGTKFESQPGHQDIGEVYKRINMLASAQSKQAGHMESMNELLARMDNYMRNNK